jgi:hypothetical protein
MSGVPLAGQAKSSAQKMSLRFHLMAISLTALSAHSVQLEGQNGWLTLSRGKTTLTADALLMLNG